MSEAAEVTRAVEQDEEANRLAAINEPQTFAPTDIEASGVTETAGLQPDGVAVGHTGTANPDEQVAQEMGGGPLNESGSILLAD